MHTSQTFSAHRGSDPRTDLRNEEATNIKIKTQLDCKEYIGNYPALQETDVPWRVLDVLDVLDVLAVLDVLDVLDVLAFA